MKIAKEHNLKVVEDACQAHGATFNGKKVGSFGIAAAHSFYPTKNLSCLGDGGAITTDNDILAMQLKHMRFYDWDSKKNAQSVCGQSRLDAIQAAVLSVKLQYLDQENERRREIARAYHDSLLHLRRMGSGKYGQHILHLPGVFYDDRHVFHQFVIRDRYAQRLRGHLEECGVMTGVHYPTLVHRQHAYSAGAGERLSERNLISLPMYPELSDDNVDQIAKAVRSFRVLAWNS